MRIGYLAKHDSGGSDDEGAITYALTKLGHNVQRLREERGDMVLGLECDFLLFHKWCDPVMLRQVKVPKIFWYFDLVEYPDPTLERRNATRREWMNVITPLVDLGFCTDGDWVAKDKSGKLVLLRQGADERIIGKGDGGRCAVCDGEWSGIPILFTGIGKNGGDGRNRFVEDVKARYGKRFKHVASGVYREQLKDLIASTRIVVAPDSPVTAKYWSNRIYNALGFGAFLIHLYANDLLAEYGRNDLVTYSDREDLFNKVDYYLDHDAERKLIAFNGLATTIKRHLYRYRCEKLVNIVKERLL